MARQGNLNMSGSVRVVQTATNGGVGTAAFLAGTNNGAFERIEYVRDGQAEIVVDDDYRLSEADIIDVRIEGDVAGTTGVERLSETRFRVTTWNQQSWYEALPYSITLTQRFFG